MSGGQRNFFQQVIDNIKQELNKNKEMKESLKKFREERQKLEESEALKKARQKFENIEAETASLKKALGGIKEKVSETVEELQKTEVIKKGREITEELGKTAGRAAETLSKSGQQITQTSAYKSVSQGVKAVKEEFDDVTLSKARVYRAPEKLKKRKELSRIVREDRHLEENKEAMGMVLHKDSRFYQSWQNFKDNNQYVTKLFDLKVKYDESDNIMIRTTRAFTDKLSQMFGGLFTKTEMSEVLTEVCKVDPTFNKEAFVRICERDIIPNILEALIRGDLEILQDWCHEAPFNTLAHPIKQALAAGYRFDSKVLDISNVDVMAGKLMEQGPVLVISFHAQQIMSVRDSKGAIVEGDKDKTLRVMYVWALCRDQEELDPIAAWKLMDISASTSEQWL
ncbi:mitochondrial import inner membrane translocase subunit TIM44-like [Pomacea canaliculata]|uniref:mitochondrial import inner membrane translocase subunit TIM44-like n=1 Tax=Pomacea canaliculata TaxID=400727 RepID=UPI000D738838|nr:mitochondrial import inner membrane translocase subunit TIM44-like [Pomacea canaliculata]XP_025077097.1 mitochondrial import inner membrane translocase subunit TIM44-like [Pomacea canaliculata]